jgi:hypothetical protein
VYDARAVEWETGDGMLGRVSTLSSGGGGGLQSENDWRHGGSAAAEARLAGGLPQSAREALCEAGARCKSKRGRAELGQKFRREARGNSTLEGWRVGRWTSSPHAVPAVLRTKAEVRITSIPHRQRYAVGGEEDMEPLHTCTYLVSLAIYARYEYAD